MPVRGASQEQIEQFASQEQIEQFEISPTLPWRGLTPPFLDHSSGPYWEPDFEEEDIEAAVAAAQLRLSGSSKHEYSARRH